MHHRNRYPDHDVDATGSEVEVGAITESLISSTGPNRIGVTDFTAAETQKEILLTLRMLLAHAALITGNELTERDFGQ